MELWELSDGRVWQVEERLHDYYVSSLLDHGGTSRIGEFRYREDIAMFAQEFLRLYVTYIVR